MFMHDTASWKGLRQGMMGAYCGRRGDGASYPDAPKLATMLLHTDDWVRVNGGQCTVEVLRAQERMVM
jgi:hypothetical protein